MKATFPAETSQARLSVAVLNTPLSAAALQPKPTNQGPIGNSAMWPASRTRLVSTDPAEHVGWPTTTKSRTRLWSAQLAQDLQRLRT